MKGDAMRFCCYLWHHIFRVVVAKGALVLSEVAALLVKHELCEF